MRNIVQIKLILVLILAVLLVFAAWPLYLKGNQNYKNEIMDSFLRGWTKGAVTVIELHRENPKSTIEDLLEIRSQDSLLVAKMLNE